MENVIEGDFSIFCEIVGILFKGATYEYVPCTAMFSMLLEVCVLLHHVGRIYAISNKRVGLG